MQTFVTSSLFGLVITLLCIACGTEPEPDVRFVKVEPSFYSTLADRVPVSAASAAIPMSAAIADEFNQRGNSIAEVSNVGSSRALIDLCANQTVIAVTSRPITQKEIDRCERNEVDFIEIPVAIDALVIAVSQENDFLRCITTNQLNLLWRDDSEQVITRWNQLDSSWPAQPIKLHGAPEESGTFVSFADAITGTKKTRNDYSSFQDPSVVVGRIADDELAVGYVSHAYYVANQSIIRAVSIDAGQGCAAPSRDNVVSETYTPLTRPLFLYVRADALDHPYVSEFVSLHLDPLGRQLIESAGYFPFDNVVYELGKTRFSSGMIGTVFGGDNAHTGRVKDGLSR